MRLIHYFLQESRILWVCDLYSRATYNLENFVHVDNMHPLLMPAILGQNYARDFTVIFNVT